MQHRAKRTEYPQDEKAIVKHIRAAAFLNPRMIASQWGLDHLHARHLYHKHYHSGRTSD